MLGDLSSYRFPQALRSCWAILITLFSLIFAACDDSGSSMGNSIRDIHTTECIDNVAASDRHEFQCGGVDFKVLLTQECIDQACGLIVDVHGWLSNADEQEKRSTLVSAAMHNGGYIVVQPSELSEPPSWDGAILTILFLILCSRR